MLICQYYFSAPPVPPQAPAVSLQNVAPRPNLEFLDPWRGHDLADEIADVLDRFAALDPEPAEKNTHAKTFDGGTVEAEAIPAHVTRRLVREAIEQHLDLREVEVMQIAETSEAEYLERLAEVLEEDAA